MKTKAYLATSYLNIPPVVERNTSYLICPTEIHLQAEPKLTEIPHS